MPFEKGHKYYPSKNKEDKEESKSADKSVQFVGEGEADIIASIMNAPKFDEEKWKQSVELVDDYDVEKQVDSKRSGYFSNLVDSFDVEASVMVLFIGGRFGFSFGQFIDFLTGWFGLDIADDDNFINFR